MEAVHPFTVLYHSTIVLPFTSIKRTYPSSPILATEILKPLLSKLIFSIHRHCLSIIHQRLTKEDQVITSKLLYL